MSSWNEIIDCNNRVKYSDLVGFVLNSTVTSFFSCAKHPFLVWKELYDGCMNKREGMTNTSTMMFEAAEAEVETNCTGKTLSIPNNEPGVTRSLYVLDKPGTSSNDSSTIITLGRASENDITIADYVVSKKHVEIVIEGSEYYITDLGSTNYTLLNGIKLLPGIKTELPINSEIAFGRYSFIFTDPLHLYKRIKSQ